MFYHVPYALDNIAAWYDNAPSGNTDARALALAQWYNLALETQAQVTRLLCKYDIEILRVTGQPYNDVQDMFDEIDSGKLQVTSDNSSHPAWLEDTSFNFSVWHDLAHYEAFSSFEYGGEVKAYEKQLEHIELYSVLPYKDLRHALFVEVLGQAASMIWNGKFSTQKVF